MTTTPNEINGKWLGACGLNPFHQHNSSARIQMFGSHLGQMLTISGSTPRMIQTGSEREYGKYTFRIEMPCNGLILEVIERYPPTMGAGSIQGNPETVVIYEDIETKEIGIIRLTEYCSNHQYFGFRYAKKPGLNQLRVGATVAKGVVFLDSPSIKDEGEYAYGLQANVAYMTMPGTSEDGFIVSEDFLPKVGFRTYESRAIDWGKKKFALNLYGDENNYKPFPDVGDLVRADGVLMALRSYEPLELAVVEQGIHSTRQIDYTFDTTVYANGPGGRVVDVRIHHDAADFNYAERHMDGQMQKYDNARRHFYAKILDTWKRLKHRRGDSLQITPEFHQLVVHSQSIVSEGGKARVSKLYRNAPLDLYRVEIVVEYDVVPNIGFKLTDVHGGKGVICQIKKPHEMPIDQDGNRADIIVDPNGTINRANPGRLYEQYISASARDTHKRLCAKLSVNPFAKQILAYNAISKLPKEVVEDAYSYLLEFYAIVSPRMRSWFDEGKIEATPIEYLSEVVEKGCSLYIPTDNEPMTQDIVTALEQKYRPTYGPVTYIGNSGTPVTTVNNVRIGSQYFLLLEKTGDDWSAVSSGKLQHFGVLSQLTRGDKYAKPARNQAVRGAGEAEVRIFVSYIGPTFVAEIMDRNNNPKTHKAMVENLLKSETPGNVDKLVDRRSISYGGSKPLQLLKHVLQCGGIKYSYKPYVSSSYQQSSISFKQKG